MALVHDLFSIVLKSNLCFFRFSHAKKLQKNNPDIGNMVIFFSITQDIFSFNSKFLERPSFFYKKISSKNEMFWANFIKIISQNSFKQVLSRLKILAQPHDFSNKPKNLSNSKCHQVVDYNCQKITENP